MSDPIIDCPASDAPTPAQTRVLGIFAKAWDQGKVKTRLAKTLGDNVAAEVYLRLLVLHLKRFAQAGELRSIAYSPATDQTRQRFADLIASHLPAATWRLEPQIESDLGTRMNGFFEHQFKASPDGARVVLIGSDAPRLTPQIVDTAFEFLKQHDVVLGPSTDGGYYLVGLSRSAEAIFQGIDWSTELVLQQTLSVCEQHGFSVAQLPALTDIDHEEDLSQELNLLDSSDDQLVQEFLQSVAPLYKRTPS